MEYSSQTGWYTNLLDQYILNMAKQCPIIFLLYLAILILFELFSCKEQDILGELLWVYMKELRLFSKLRLCWFLSSY